MDDIKTPRDIVTFIQKEKIEVVDLRFMYFPGLWQHFSVPAREMKEETFEKGLGFDGSSIRGWQVINESDMLVKPVPETAFVDPFFANRTLVLICNICDPITGENYTRRPPQYRPQGGSLSQEHRPGRHRVHRARGGILYF